jgi:hypothetical protein
MKDTEEPRRLLADPATPRRTGEALRAWRAAAGPAPDQVARLAAAVARGISARPELAAVPAPPRPLARTAGLALLLTVAKVTLVAAAIGGGTWLVVAPRRPAPEPESAPAPRPRLERRALPRAPEAAPPVEEPVIEKLPPRPVLHHRRREPVVAVPPAPAPAPAPVPVIAPAPAADDRAARLRAEAQLIQGAEAALAARPREALRLVEEHRRRYPAGALVQEGEVIAIEATLRLGDRAEAERRAAAFLAAHRDSAHALRIERLLKAK